MSTRHHRPSPRVLGAVAIVLGLLLTAWGVVLTRGVHDDATELAWLRTHAPVRSYRVVELGEMGGDGHLDGAWVDVPGQPRAFIDLSRSGEQVHAVGDALRAHVDEREAPALAEGLPADVVSSGIGSRYVVPGLVLAGGVVLVGLGGLSRRSSRPRRSAEKLGAAGH